MLIDQMQYNFLLQKQRTDSEDRRDYEPYEIDEYLNAAIFLFCKKRFAFDPNKRGFETDSLRLSQLSNLHIKSPQVQPGIAPVELQPGLYELNLNRLGENLRNQYFRYMFLTEAYVDAHEDACNKCINLKHSPSVQEIDTYSESSWLWRRVNYSFGKSTYQQEHLSDLNMEIVLSPDTTMDLVNNFTRKFTNDELSSLYIDTRDRDKIPQFTISKVYVSYIKYPNRVFSGGYDHVDGLSTSLTEPIHCDIDEIFHDDIVRIAVRLSEKDINLDYNSLIQDEMLDHQI
jgi:hypothetical protein